MQKTNIQSLRLVPKKFSEFCRRSSVLPRTTPLFMIDKRGRTVAKKNITRLPGFFESVAEIISDEGFEDFAAKHGKCDFFAVRLDKKIEKGYIAVSNVGEGLCGCVLCSLSEKGCKKLSEYFGRLCSYRDHLDVFSSKAVTDSAGISAKEVFDSRINGIGYLLNLHLSYEAQRRKAHLPLMTVFEKIRTFTERINETEALPCNIIIDGDNPSASIQLGFVSVAVSCLGLAARNSCDGRVTVHISGKDKEYATIKIECNGKGSENEDIYAGAVMDAARDYCFGAALHQTKEMLCIEIKLQKAVDERLVVSEPAELDRQLGDILYLDELANMFSAIVDI